MLEIRDKHATAKAEFMRANYGIVLIVILPFVFFLISRAVPRQNSYSVHTLSMTEANLIS